MHISFLFQKYYLRSITDYYTPPKLFVPTMLDHTYRKFTMTVIDRKMMENYFLHSSVASQLYIQIPCFHLFILLWDHKPFSNHFHSSLIHNTRKTETPYFCISPIFSLSFAIFSHYTKNYRHLIFNICVCLLTSLQNSKLSSRFFGTLYIKTFLVMKSLDCSATHTLQRLLKLNMVYIWMFKFFRF